MAEALVSGMVEEWKPDRYRDEYRDDLLSLIEKRAKAGLVNKITAEKPAKRRKKGPEVVNLADLLKQSVAQRANESRGRPERKRRKAKASVRKTRPEKALRKAS